jgi:hypothetical protein
MDDLAVMTTNSQMFSSYSDELRKVQREQVNGFPYTFGLYIVSKSVTG